MSELGDTVVGFVSGGIRRIFKNRRKNNYDEEEEDYYDEDIERELKAGFTEYDQCEAKEGTSSMGKLEGKTKGWDRVGASTKD